MIKALALLSGGLDSLLAARLIQNQGVAITGLSFQSYFFKPYPTSTSYTSSLVSDFSPSHLKIVLKPKYGYGKNMNPCLDCHLLMLKTAKKIMTQKKYDFLITGEVLGQRPFSQTKPNLNLLEKEAGLTGLILRPLSAQLLPPTLPEIKGWVDRSKLLAIQGRSRKIQLQLAKKYGLSGFSAPGTSCILTDPGFSQRLKSLLTNCPLPTANDLQLLRLGRHYWRQPTRQDSSTETRPNRQSEISRKLGGSTLIVLGRNHQENLKLKKLKQKKDLLLELKSLPGPTVLIRPYSLFSSGIAQFIARSSVLAYAKKLLLSHSHYHLNKNLSKNDFKVNFN